MINLIVKVRINCFQTQKSIYIDIILTKIISIHYKSYHFQMDNNEAHNHIKSLALI